MHIDFVSLVDAIVEVVKNDENELKDFIISEKVCNGCIPSTWRSS